MSKGNENHQLYRGCGGQKDSQASGSKGYESQATTQEEQRATKDRRAKY